MSAPNPAMREIESRLADVEATTAILERSENRLREALHSLMWASRELLEWGEGSDALVKAYANALEVVGTDAIGEWSGQTTRPLKFRTEA